MSECRSCPWDISTMVVFTLHLENSAEFWGGALRTNVQKQRLHFINYTRVPFKMSFIQKDTQFLFWMW